jgi:NAD-dependent dihydropyrimidine dehydrogenase PreA subunit
MTTGLQGMEYVRFREDRCTGCAACLRRCPTQAIRIRHRKSIRIVGQCIGCGSCIRACPAGAVTAATRMPEAIGTDHAAIALVSPVLYAQFQGTVPGAVLLALQQLGFRHTIDLSFFLEMFQRAAEEFIRRNRAAQQAPWPLISPTCPVVVRLIAFKFPSLLSHILPVLRPVALMAREVRERILPVCEARGEKTVLTFINPCPTLAESRPGRRAAGRRPPVAAVGINDIYPALKARVEKILAADTLPFGGSHFEFESCSSGNAALGAMTGGEIAGMDVENTLAVHGLEETIAYLHKIEMGLLDDIEYIEFRTCHEACLGGVLAAVDKYVAKRNVQAMVRKLGLGSRLPRETILRLYEKGGFRPEQSPLQLTRLFGSRKPALSLAELARIESLLETIAGRDCGACGSPDCRTFAEDVVRGESDLADCIWRHTGARRARGGPAGKGDSE